MSEFELKELIGGKVIELEVGDDWMVITIEKDGKKYYIDIDIDVDEFFFASLVKEIKNDRNETIAIL